MSDPIPCPECGHDFDYHLDATPCWAQPLDSDPLCECELPPSHIARAYGEECFHDGWDACELRWAVRHSE